MGQLVTDRRRKYAEELVLWRQAVAVWNEVLSPFLSLSLSHSFLLSLPPSLPLSLSLAFTLPPSLSISLSLSLSLPPSSLYVSLSIVQ